MKLTTKINLITKIKAIKIGVEVEVKTQGEVYNSQNYIK